MNEYRVFLSPLGIPSDLKQTHDRRGARCDREISGCRRILLGKLDRASSVGSPRLALRENRPVWWANIEYSNHLGAPRGWVLIQHTVDAATGESAKTSFDDKPETQVMFTE